MNGKEIRKLLKDHHKSVRSILVVSIPEAKDFNDLNEMAAIAFDIDAHDYLGRLFAQRADELGVDELSVGEYDRGRVLLKIKEVPEAEDYYGFSEVDIGDWVSSNY